MVPWKSAELASRGRWKRALQWGHGDGAVEESLLLVMRITQRTASMGPRRWCRGREWTHLLCPVASNRFNGATAMVPWKRTDLDFLIPAADLLQWGHGDGAVEEVEGVIPTLPIVSASMGPRRWCRGRDSQPCPDCGGTGSFNGATAMVPWKSREG